MFPKLFERPKQELKILKRLILPCTFLLSGYFLGAYSFAHAIWPTDIISSRHNAAVAKALSKNFDKLGAFSNLVGKKEVVCPTQEISSAVMLVLGQSNSANYSEEKHKTRFPDKVLNYFLGKCYSAASPLLGASGLEGEYLTPMGDLLIKSGNFQEVIIVNASIGGSKVNDWADNGRLTKKLVRTLDSLKLKYIVTHIIWHQGESDFANKTSFNQYKESFLSLEKSLLLNGVSAPTYIITSTICGYNSNWTAQNSVALAQKSLVNDRDIFLGMDADASLSTRDRRSQSPSQEPNCHLSSRGQVKVSNAIAKKISESETKSNSIDSSSSP